MRQKKVKAIKKALRARTGKSGKKGFKLFIRLLKDKNIFKAPLKQILKEIESLPVKKK